MSMSLLTTVTLFDYVFPHVLCLTARPHVLDSVPFFVSLTSCVFLVVARFRLDLQL